MNSYMNSGVPRFQMLPVCKPVLGKNHWRRTLANPSQLLHPSRRLEEAHSLKGICAEDRDRRLQARAHDGPVHAPAPLGGGRPQCSASALPVTRTPPGGGDARRHYHAQRRGLRFLGPASSKRLQLAGRCHLPRGAPEGGAAPRHQHGPLPALSPSGRARARRRRDVVHVRGNATGACTGGVAHRDQRSVGRDSDRGADRHGHGTDPDGGRIQDSQHTERAAVRAGARRASCSDPHTVAAGPGPGPRLFKFWPGPVGPQNRCRYRTLAHAQASSRHGFHCVNLSPNAYASRCHYRLTFEALDWPTWPSANGQKDTHDAVSFFCPCSFDRAVMGQANDGD